jgi:D-lactate dehydrogenase (cytochrome)
MSLARAETPAAEAVAELQALLGERAVTGQAVREHHAKGESYHPAALPDAVVYPDSTEEVAAVVKICARHRVPVIPFGAGSSLEGHVNALSGGVSIDLGNMNRILRVSPEDMDCTVEAGVHRVQLNEYLRDTGLFFPIDPGADATIGGMAATRASGTNAVRYGTMREVVLGLTVVTAEGRIVHTGGRARKSSAGYDLTRLFVGAEGTLGVITEVTLRLFGIPEAVSAAICAFPDMAAAVNSVIATMQAGVPIARIELIDEDSIAAINAYSKLDLKVAPTLFLEFHGSEAGVVEQAETVEAIAHEFGGEDFEWSTRQEERNRLWQARHDMYYAALKAYPGRRGFITDVCVPISRLADCILGSLEDVAQSPLAAPMVGHVGDGNFHLCIMVEDDNAADLEEAKRLNQLVVDRALAMGGTCTGEHGVGYGKIASVEKEHGDAVVLMRAIKKALDPDNIMNPGKVVRLNA